MGITERHREVESRFRDVLADAVLPQPDGVAYEPGAVIFLWHGPQVAVAVDFDGSAGDGLPDDVAAALAAGLDGRAAR